MEIKNWTTDKKKVSKKAYKTLVKRKEKAQGLTWEKTQKLFLTDFLLIFETFIPLMAKEDLFSQGHKQQLGMKWYSLKVNQSFTLLFMTQLFCW